MRSGWKVRICKTSICKHPTTTSRIPTSRRGATVPSHGNSFLTFQNTDEYRYWRLALSQRRASDPNYRVAKVFLMRLLLDLNTDEKRTLHHQPTIPRDGVVAYRNQNRKLNALGYEQTNTSAYLSLGGWLTGQMNRTVPSS